MSIMNKFTKQAEFYATANVLTALFQAKLIGLRGYYSLLQEHAQRYLHDLPAGGQREEQSAARGEAGGHKA